MSDESTRASLPLAYAAGRSSEDLNEIFTMTAGITSFAPGSTKTSIRADNDYMSGAYPFQNFLYPASDPRLQSATGRAALQRAINAAAQDAANNRQGQVVSYRMRITDTGALRGVIDINSDSQYGGEIDGAPFFESQITP